MEEAHRKYDSVFEMMHSMPCQLKWKFLGSGAHPCILFKSKNNDELQRHLTDPSIAITPTPTGEIDQDFSIWLNHVSEENSLLQIWAPVTIGDKQYLTTSDQLFAMRELVKGLCSYRKHCLDYLIPVDDDLSTEGGLVGPPGRVLRNGMPEVCLDVGHYTCAEYPLRDKALACGIYYYLALPMSCGRVLELAHDGPPPRSWRDFRLMFEDPELSLGPTIPEIKDMLRAVCRTHGLPLAQTWVSMPPDSTRFENEAVKYKNGAFYAVNDDYDGDDEEGSFMVDYDFRDFILACHFCCIKTGRGVVGKAFSSKGACFCKDVCQLSIDEYSLVPNARHAGLTGCFAISLTHRACCSINCLSVVEFFFDKETQSGDPRTLIKMLLATMKEHLKNFRVASGQELGENLFVEVIKTSPTDELDSFDICAFTGVDNTLSDLEVVLRGGDGMALDHERGANMFPDTNNLNQHGGEVKDQCDDNSKILKNQRATKRINREYGITHADLLQHSQKKLKEAADHFAVSRSTFKRICRAHQIFRWPPRKSKHDNGPSSSKPDTTQNAATVQNDSSILVEVEYRKKINQL